MHPGAVEVCDGVDNDCDGELSQQVFLYSSNTPSTNNISTAAGGLFSVDRDVHLRGFRIEADTNGEKSLQWTVYEGDAATGPYTAIHSHTTVSDSNDFKWYDSGELDILLKAGSHYILRTTFSQSRVRFGSVSYPPASALQTGWGQLLGTAVKVGSTWQPGTSLQRIRVTTGYDEGDGDEDGVEACADCDDDDPGLGDAADDADCDGALLGDDCDDGDPLLGAIADDGDCDGIPTVDDCDDDDPALPPPGDFDCDGVLSEDDCDDTDPASTVKAIDADCDGVLTADDCDDGDGGLGDQALDGDCDGALTDADCDDDDPDIYPDAKELCDGVDNNCDESLVWAPTFEWSTVTGSSSAAGRFRGDLFHAEDDALLTAFEIQLDATAGQALTWHVFERLSPEDPTFTRIHESGSVAATSALAWHGSGPLALPLQAGADYALLLSWGSPQATFSWGSMLAPLAHPADTTWGALSGGVNGYTSQLTDTPSFSGSTGYVTGIRVSTLNLIEEDQDEDGTIHCADCDDDDPDSTVVAEDQDCDQVVTADDCDDADPALGDVAFDGDCDGVLTADDCDDDDASLGAQALDGDCDGVLTADDCDDDDPALPATDMDCDGSLTDDDCDDDDPSLGDMASDGDCDGALVAVDCDDEDPLLGDIGLDADCDGVVTAEDCDDTEPSVYPGAEELCDGVDTDCDGQLGYIYTFEWVGNNDDSYGPGGYYYGTKFLADDDETVSEFAFRMDKSTSTTSGLLYWRVYESDTEDGTFTRIFDDTSGICCSGPAWHSSGPVEIPLVAGRYYAFTVASSKGFYVDTGSIAQGPQSEEASWGTMLGSFSDSGVPSINEAFPTGDWGYSTRIVSGPSENDADEDGYWSCEECNDHEAAANPDAAEICDEIDNDCDGAIDTDDTDLDDCGPVVCDGNFEINDDSYLGGLSLCTEITGDLVITSPLTDLDGMEHLTTVGGDLTIEHNTQLTNLDGLAGLTTVVGDFTLYNNDQLPDLSGLGSLTSVGGEFEIWSNDGLTALTGLSSLVSMPGDLKIRSNPALPDLTGLEALTSISGDLTLWDNQAMTQLTGLSNLASVDGSFTIQYCGALLDVDALSGLTAVGSKLSLAFNDSLASLSGLDGLSTVLLLEIKGNDAIQLIAGFNDLAGPVAYLDINFNDDLTDISGFGSLAQVSSSMHINGNGGLTDISGFGALQSVGSILQIGNNSQLCTSIVDAFVDGITVGSLLSTTGNDDGC